jgi:hypothetical protein
MGCTVILWEHEELRYKGTVPQDFLPLIFHELVSSKPLTRYLKAFRIWHRIRGNIRK